MNVRYGLLFAIFAGIACTALAAEQPAIEGESHFKSPKNSSPSDPAAPVLTKRSEKTVIKKGKLSGSFRGWSYLVNRLYQDGISEKRLKSIFNSRRLPRFVSVPFSVAPRESKRIYAPFFHPGTMKIARRFLKKHSSIFAGAEKHFGVSRYVIASILYIETKCGQYTGDQVVLYRLARLANIAESANLKKNYKRLKKDDASVKLTDVVDRGKYLEEMFYPEIPALFEIAQRNKINVFGIRGSRAGAFGLPQFLPSTYIKFGYDGNKDGKISLFQVADAVWSAANFLSSFGWKDSLSDDAKKKILWRYNRSEAYVETVLKVAKALEKKMR